MSTRPDMVFSRSELRQIMRQAQKVPVGEVANETWDIRKSILWGYCCPSFEDVGLVAQKVVDSQDNLYGYSLTPTGGQEGVALSGLLLNFSMESGIPLYYGFGSTKSSSVRTEIINSNGVEMSVRSRTPGRQYKILRSLVHADTPRRWTDLVANQGDEKLAEDLLNLSRAGIITYEVGDRKGFASYIPAEVFPETFPRSFGENVTLTKEVYLLIKSGSLSAITPNEVLKAFPHREKEADIKGKIAGILKYLEKGNYLQSIGFHKEDQSRAYLNEQQRELISPVITDLEAFQRRDPEVMSRGKRYAREIFSDPHAVRALLAKARRFSPSANPPDGDDVIEALRDMIFRSETPLSNRDILIMLEEQGIHVGRLTARKYMEVLQDEGVVKVVEDNKQLHYWARVDITAA